MFEGCDYCGLGDAVLDWSTGAVLCRDTPETCAARRAAKDVRQSGGGFRNGDPTRASDEVGNDAARILIFGPLPKPAITD